MTHEAEHEKRRDAASTMTHFHYFDPDDSIENLSGNLPHWRQKDVIYFVTFRLGDSIPQAKLKLWMDERQTWMAAHPQPHTSEIWEEYYRLFPERMQNWLDAGYGECLLAQSPLNTIVTQALMHFDKDRYNLDEFIIMPNHVHVLVTPTNGHELSDILHSWKSYTAHEMNKALGRKGQIWQKETFDHIVRSSAQLDRVRRYIRDNPKCIADLAIRRRIETMHSDAINVKSGGTPLLQ